MIRTRVRRCSSVGVFLSALAIALPIHAKERPEHARPTVTIDQALLWLPANTETILVAQGPFELKPMESSD